MSRDLRTWPVRLRALLPVGQTLPEHTWRARHTGVIVVLWAHAAAIPVFALVRGYSLTHSLLESSIVPATAAFAMTPSLPRRTRTAVASIGLLSTSAILVHLSGGVIEMHFHFFVMVALVTLYQDWLPFLAAIAYVFIHHGLMGALDPDSVYNHAAAQNGPWKWAGIHALFISGISVVCLVTWRLNEGLLADRQAAEERLREETRIVETLHEVGQTLAAELDTRRVVQAVTDAAVSLTNAEFGAFFYNVTGADGNSYQLFTLSGAPHEAFEKFDLPRATQIFSPTFTGEQIMRLDDVTKDPRYGQMGPHFGMPPGHLPVRSYLAVPVRARTGDVLGGLFFAHPEPGRFTPVDERIVVGIAGQAAIAIDNARLYESERIAHAASEAARIRLALLAEVSKALTSSLEVDAVLRALAQIVTPALADCCVVDVITDNGGLRRVASAWARDADRIDVRPPDMDSLDHPIVRAARRGEPRVVGGRELYGDAVPEYSTSVVVPLAGRHEVLGTLSLLSLHGTLSESDLPFAEELARRAAIAVENGRLYARQRTVAETLQHSLLPDRLPDLPGLASAAQYVAGGPDVEVGGDWYDVVQLPGGHIALVIGDVVGRGERAAALMGQLRSSLRAYCRERHSPDEIVTRLNEMLLAAGPEYMATMIYVLLDVETGSLEYVNAGHPAPLIVTADGSSVFLDGSGGVPIGAVPGARYAVASATLPPGGTILLYTDGLVEDRVSSIDLGMDRLRNAALSAPEDLDELCGHVMRLALAGRNTHDDAAILAVRLLALGPSLQLRLPSQTSVLAPLRGAMRRWLREIGASEEESYELLVVAGELCANAIRHASGPARSHFEIDVDYDDDVFIVVRDEGRWRRTSAGEGGRGLDIVREYVDELDIRPGPSGTEVRVRRSLASAGPRVA